MDGQTDTVERKNGWMDGWVDGWMSLVLDLPLKNSCVMWASIHFFETSWVRCHIVVLFGRRPMQRLTVWHAEGPSESRSIASYSFQYIDRELRLTAPDLF